MFLVSLAEIICVTFGDCGFCAQLEHLIVDAFQTNCYPLITVAERARKQHTAYADCRNRLLGIQVIAPVDNLSLASMVTHMRIQLLEGSLPWVSSSVAHLCFSCCLKWGSQPETTVFKYGFMVFHDQIS